MREVFARAYVEAAIWADAPEDYGGPGLDYDSVRALMDSARSFYDQHEADVNDYPEGIEQAGHDLWFTQCGHGVGYWENEGNPAADRLDAACRKEMNQSVYIYEGDDGLLYVG